MFLARRFQSAAGRRTGARIPGIHCERNVSGWPRGIADVHRQEPGQIQGACVSSLTD